MTETVTLLRPHLPHSCFAIVQHGDCWNLRLLVNHVTVRQEAIPDSYAQALIESVSGRCDAAQCDRLAVAR